MKNIMIICLLLLSFKALSNERGNGGDAVVCRGTDGEIITAELLDYYEGRTLRNLEVVHAVGTDNESFFIEIGEKFNSLEEIYYMDITEEALSLNHALEKWLEAGISTRADIIFTTDPLTDIPDSGELILRRGCNVEQVAIRVNQRFPEDPAYIFQSEILKKLSSRDIRGLVLHEIIYKFLIMRQFSYGFNVSDSIVARYFHQKLMSREFQKFDFWEYLQILRSLYGHEDLAAPGLIRRAGLKLEVFSASKMNDGSIKISDFTKGLVVLLDSDGTPNVEKTKKDGMLTLTSELNFSNGREIGDLLIDNRGISHKHILSLTKKSTNIYFGQTKLKFNIQAQPQMSGSTIHVFVNYIGKKNQVEDVGANVALKRTSYSISKDVFFDLDEKFNVIVTNKP